MLSYDRQTIRCLRGRRLTFPRAWAFGRATPVPREELLDHPGSRHLDWMRCGRRGRRASITCTACMGRNGQVAARPSGSSFTTFLVNNPVGWVAKSRTELPRLETGADCRFKALRIILKRGRVRCCVATTWP